MKKIVSVVPALAGLFLMSPAAQAAGDPAKGKIAFLQCRVCHTIDAGGRSLLGPGLNGVVGRPIASIKGFAYSPAMAKQRGKWTPERLDAYLAGPARAVPGNRMAFAGMTNPIDRQNLIAYLATAK